MSKTTTAKPKKRKEEVKKKFLKLREKKGSMTELAKAIGVTPGYLYKVIIPELMEEYNLPKEKLLYHHSRSAKSKVADVAADATVNTEPGTTGDVTTDATNEVTVETEPGTTGDEETGTMTEAATETTSEAIAEENVEVENDPDASTIDCSGIPANATLMEILSVVKDTRTHIEETFKSFT